MKRYQFETDEFGINELGIYFLRNKFPFKQLSYNEIGEAKIRTGKIINNWIGIAIMGIGMLSIGIFLALHFHPKIDERGLNVRGAKGIGYLIIMVLSLIATGILLISNAFKKDLILELSYNKSKSTFPLTKIRVNQSSYEFEQYLKEKFKSKLIIKTREY